MSNKPGACFEQGSLWERLTGVTEQALRSGSLLPIPTGYEFVENGGVRFFVRILSSLARKDEAKRQQNSPSGKQSNPFLPYEKDLYISDVSETHVAVLNKFNVVDHHLLIITREFEDQETLLTLRDFESLWTCLAEYPALGFYNGGTAAGASQPHKHLQLVPLPLAPEGPRIPIEPLLNTAKFSGGFGTVDVLPFLHVFCRLESAAAGPIAAAAERAFALYAEMLGRMGMRMPERDRIGRQSGPYCLLVTREWMLLVPRSQEFFEGISINSLGFAGALLVRNNEQMELLKKQGPMSVLKAVALPKK